LQATRHALRPLKLVRAASDDGKMLEDKKCVDTTGNEAGSDGDLAFIIFSLTHAGCGDTGVIELRLAERSLLGWCPSCAALETFGPFEGCPE
jgi:hypothetical protein